MIAWVRRNGWRFAALLILLPAYFVVETWNDLPERWQMLGTIREVPAKETITDRGMTWRLNRIEDPRPAVDSSGKPKPPRKDGIHWALVYVSFKLEPGLTLNTPKCVVRLRDTATNRVWEPNAGQIPNPDDLGTDAAQDCLSAPGKGKPKANTWYTFAARFLLPADAKNLQVEVSLGKKSDGPRAGSAWARFVP